MSTCWRIELFGGPRIVSPQGESISHFETQKSAAVLAYLALTLPRSHPREVLAELFWPERDPARGRNSLSAALSSLRPVLGAALVGDKFRIGLDPSCVRCDVAEFEARLAEGDVATAAKLAAAELLPGFYDDWILTERERLKAQLMSSPPMPLARSRRPSLPTPLTMFIGRERESKEVGALLEQSRLVTLTGAGGSGKTRLGLHVATQRQTYFSGGVFCVELAPLGDTANLLLALAQALGLTELEGQALLPTVLTFLQAGPTLLLLDNCEHVLESSAQLTAMLLRSCPTLRILATSRECLSIPGECIYRVPSLSLPPPSPPLSLSALLEYEAVCLFVERAAWHQQDFSLTPQNTRALVSVCNRLGGIPLAIELAAARTRSLSLEEIDHRLNQSFWLLTGGGRTTLPRQQTLRSSIEWSYNLLTPLEKCLLERLSIFAGSWTLEAAEIVCAYGELPPTCVLPLLENLVDKSLVLTQRKNGTTRYSLLKTIHQFAHECLHTHQVTQALEEHFQDYFVTLAERTDATLQGPEQLHGLRVLEDDYENVRSSLNQSLQATSPLRALQLCGVLGQFWMTRSHFSEGRAYCERVLERGGKGEYLPERARVLGVVGTLAYYQADYPTAKLYHEESLQLWRALENRAGYAIALNRLGHVASAQGNYGLASSSYEECLALYRLLGDRTGVATVLFNQGILAKYLANYDQSWDFIAESLHLRRELGDAKGIAACLYGLGAAARFQTKFALSQDCIEESLTLRRELDDKWGVALCLIGLSETLKARGNLERALRCLEESTQLRREIGDRWGMAWLLNNYSSLAATLGKPRLAATLWGAAEALRESLGTPISLNKRAQVEQELATVREVLGIPTFAMMRAWGRTMSLEQALDLALSQVRLGTTGDI